jgi:hypothetical protein
VTLPAALAIEVKVLSAINQPIERPRFQLLPGPSGRGAAEFFLLGFSNPVDLSQRVEKLEDGRWRLDPVDPGSYTLLIDAPGHGQVPCPVDVADATVSFETTLPAPIRTVVKVIDEGGKPIANVDIHAEANGSGRLIDMPIRVGRTKADGVCTIEKLTGEKLRVSAEHPKWGVVGGEVKVGEEITLQMTTPGSLLLTVTDGGKPPELGKFTVLVMSERRRGERGPFEETPTMLTPALDGTVAVKALQPGKYEVTAIKSLDSLRSPGGMYSLMQDMFMMRNQQSADVEIASAIETALTFEVGDKPIEGPTAQLSGIATVDGKLASGHGLQARVQGKQQNFTARVDERGRFDFGTVAAGKMNISMMARSEEFFAGPPSTLWATEIELTPGEARELSIDVTTSSISGVCYRPDGQPAPGVWVQANGKPKGAPADTSALWTGVSTDSSGTFRFPQVAAGTWTLSARGQSRRGSSGGRAELAPVEVAQGAPVTDLRIELKMGAQVAGTIDFAVLGARKPRWSWLRFERLDGENRRGNRNWVSIDEGAFTTDELAPGRYRVELNAQFEEDAAKEFPCGEIEVPAGGVSGLRLVPQAASK